MSATSLANIVLPEDCLALCEALEGEIITLASGSPRRRELLSECGIRYRLTKPMVDEPEPSGPNLREWARLWALRKALSVPSKLRRTFVLAADTIVVYEGLGLGKPRDEADARDMLSRLSGKTHQVITGVAVVDGRDAPRRQASGSAISKVTFRRISAREIAAYVATGEPLDKAGAYGIQGEAGKFVASVDGPLDNVVGLPVRRVAQLAKRIIR